jgi:hypothetical protein
MARGLVRQRQRAVYAASRGGGTGMDERVARPAVRP